MNTVHRIQALQFVYKEVFLAHRQTLFIMVRFRYICKSFTSNFHNTREGKKVDSTYKVCISTF